MILSDTSDVSEAISATALGLEGLGPKVGSVSSNFSVHRSRAENVGPWSAGLCFGRHEPFIVTSILACHIVAPPMSGDF